jgi:hypothetical protein
MSVHQYHEMVRTGIIGEDEPVELLDGWLVPKMVKSPAHSTVTDLVRRALERVLSAGWSARPREDFGPTDLVPLLVEQREVARLPVAELLPERPRPQGSLPGT